MFEVGESFDVPLLRGKSGTVRAVDSQAARKGIAKLSVAKRRGCYIFALANGKRLTPWYVGRAGQNFGQEVFNESNCKKYGEALALTRNGRPVVHFVVLPAQRGPIPQNAITKLETFLVSECGGVNPEIRNKKKAGIYKTVIAGVMNSAAGKPPDKAVAIRKLMGR